MKQAKTIFKLIAVILLWILFYVVLQPKTEYLAVTGRYSTLSILVYIVPVFVIGILLNVDHLSTCIRQKNKLNLKILLVLLIGLALLTALLINFASLDLLYSQTSFTSPVVQSGALVRLSGYLSIGGLYIAIALCCGYLITCLFDKKTLKHIIRVIVFLAVWILFYKVLLQKLRAYSAQTWYMDPLYHRLVYAFPFFIAGILLHIDNLITSIRQKNPLNKVGLGIVILFVLLIGITFFSNTFYLPYAFYALFVPYHLCLGYSLTCLFE